MTLADIQRSITASSAAVCGKLDLLTAEVASIKRRQTELEDSVSMNSDLVANLQHVKLPAIEKKMGEKIADLEEKIVIMEIYNRRANLLFYGVNETPDEKVRDVLQKVFIHLGINEREANDIAIANAHRLPRRNNGATASSTRPQAPNAIIAKFVYMEDRNRLLAAFENGQRQRISQDRATASVRITVRTDLPPALKARRGMLAKIAYDLRKQKGVSTKIIVVGASVELKWKEKNTSKWNNQQE